MILCIRIRKKKNPQQHVNLKTLNSIVSLTRLSHCCFLQMMSASASHCFVLIYSGSIFLSLPQLLYCYFPAAFGDDANSYLLYYTILTLRRAVGISSDI